MLNYAYELILEQYLRYGRIWFQIIWNKVCIDINSREYNTQNMVHLFSY
jgi:hypothetical protein